MEFHSKYESKTNGQTYLVCRCIHFSIWISNKHFVPVRESNYTSGVFEIVNRKFSYIRNETLSMLLKYNKKTDDCCVGNKIILVWNSDGREFKSAKYDTNDKNPFSINIISLLAVENC